MLEDYNEAVAGLSKARVLNWRSDEAVEISDVREECTEITGNPEGGLVSLATKRPKGVRENILAAVAATASERYGVQISARYVDRCWKVYNAKGLEMIRG